MSSDPHVSVGVQSHNLTGGTSLVRDCIAGDMPAVTAIYAHHVLYGTASFEEVPPSLGEMTRRFDHVKAQGFPWLVAEVDGRVAGYAYASLYRTRSAYRFTLEDSVYIDPSMVRRGIGRALLAELLCRCESIGCRQMVAVIGDSANQASIGLHASLGFSDAGILRSVGFKFGRWLDCVFMQRSLREGDTSLPKEG